MSLTMTVNVPTAYILNDISCTIKTDNLEHPNWTYHLRFESFPEARIVPDRIDLGTYTVSSGFASPEFGISGVWLDVFDRPGQFEQPQPRVMESPEDYKATIEINPQAMTLANQVRVRRYNLSVSHKTGLLSAGTFVRPLTITLGPEAVASASVVWTIQVPVNCEPAQVFFGSIGPKTSPIEKRGVLRSADGREFRILSVESSKPVKVALPPKNQFPSLPSKVHFLDLTLEMPDESSRFLAGSVRIQIDRDDFPNVILPWSASVRKDERRASVETSEVDVSRDQTSTGRMQ